MATPNKLNLTRDQLASFLQDFEQIKQFEKLFATVNTNTNADIPAAEIAAGNSGQAANDALAQIAALAKLVELVITEPRNELGTMAILQQDNLPWIQFDTTSTVARETGRVWWDNTNSIQTLNIGMAGTNATLQVGEEMYYRVKASAAITEGQVVMFTGSVGASGALTAAPAAGLTKSTAAYVMGVATEDIANNGWGYITQFGLVRDINTTGGAEAWVDGQILYYNPAVAGVLTKTVPTAPAAKVEVATVVHAATNGSLFIRVTERFELTQLNDVESAAAVNLDLLQYNGSIWQHKSPSTISVGTATNLAGGAANRIAYQTAPSTTDFITAPTIANTFLEWSGGAFQWTSAASGSGTVTSVSGTGTVNGITLTGTVTTSGSLTLGGTLSGIGNAQLTNSTITINGSAIALGGSVSVGTVTSVAALTLGTTGTDLSSTVATGTTTPVITLNVPTASAANRGALSAADWSTFNGKQDPLAKSTSAFTSGTAQTYTAPARTTWVKITVVGPGGNGGAANTSRATGGGGGAVSIAWKSMTAGQTLTYTVGTGSGTASSVSSGTLSISTVTANSGANGTTTSYALSQTAGAAGGTATGGDVNMSGGRGGYSFGSSTTVTTNFSGKGGDCPGFGTGGSNLAMVATAGVAGVGYGAGGGGAHGNNTAASGTGGIIIFEAY